MALAKVLGHPGRSLEGFQGISATLQAGSNSRRLGTPNHVPDGNGLSRARAQGETLGRRIRDDDTTPSEGHRIGLCVGFLATLAFDRADSHAGGPLKRSPNFNCCQAALVATDRLDPAQLGAVVVSDATLCIAALPEFQ